VVQEYDAQLFLPFLVKVLVFFTPCSSNMANEVKQVVDGSLFKAIVSSEEVTHVLLMKEWFLFCRLVVDANEVANPLLWWKQNKLQFPIVAFLVS
jgi:hypothetical protein